jgi:hypothetical protein
VPLRRLGEQRRGVARKISRSHHHELVASGARVRRNELLPRGRAAVVMARNVGSIVPEALSQSVPVLVSSNAGSSELVKKFGGGLVFEPDVETSFDNAIRRVTSDRSTFSENARGAFLEAGLSESAYVEKFSGLIRRTFGIQLSTKETGLTLPRGDLERTMPEPLN